MRIIGNNQKNNGQIFWEILKRIGKISSIIGTGLECMIIVTTQKAKSRDQTFILPEFLLLTCVKNLIPTF